MATLTITRSVKHAAGVRECWGVFSADNSYATNGDPIAVTGLVRVDHCEPIVSAGVAFAFDVANQKMKAFRQKDPAAAGGADIALPEVGNTTDLSAIANVPAHFFGS